MTTKKEPKIHVYKTEIDGVVRAIKAKNPNEAIQHFFAPKIERVEGAELVELIESGVQIEKAV